MSTATSVQNSATDPGFTILQDGTISIPIDPETMSDKIKGFSELDKRAIIALDKESHQDEIKALKYNRMCFYKEAPNQAWLTFDKWWSILSPTNAKIKKAWDNKMPISGASYTKESVMKGWKSQGIMAAELRVTNGSRKYEQLVICYAISELNIIAMDAPYHEVVINALYHYDDYSPISDDMAHSKKWGKLLTPNRKTRDQLIVFTNTGDFTYAQICNAFHMKNNENKPLRISYGDQGVSKAGYTIGLWGLMPDKHGEESALSTLAVFTTRNFVPSQLYMPLVIRCLKDSLITLSEEQNRLLAWKDIRIALNRVDFA